MWMMDYNEPHDQHYLKIDMNIIESFTTNNGCRKFKPLTPPPTSTTAASSSSTTGFFSGHLNHLHPLDHHLMTARRKEIELNSSAPPEIVVVSSRWNPTPEQLQTLEEMYRRGTRTPSADEIQRITTQLRRYGKIEGKNVFYWFQNHKARERKKRRRQQLHNATKEIHQPSFFTSDINNLDQAVHYKNSEVEETRNWAIPTFSEKSVVRERKGQTESRMTKPAGMIIVQEEEEGSNHELLHLHQRRNIIWNHMMHSLSSSSSSSNNHRTIDPSTLTTTTSATKKLPTVVVSSHCHQQHPHEVDCWETLELFPINHHGHAKEQPKQCFVPTGDIGLGPRQFIEFLPLKN